MIISNARRSILSDRGVESAPDLIVEITEPATCDHDRGITLRRYATTGVAHYWIVDALEMTVEERLLGEDGYGPPTIHGVGDVFEPALFPGFAIGIASLWA